MGAGEKPEVVGSHTETSEEGRSTRWGWDENKGPGLAGAGKVREVHEQLVEECAGEE